MQLMVSEHCRAVQLDLWARFELSSLPAVVQASPPGHVAPLQVDISLPFKVCGAREPPAEQLPLLRLPDGSVQVKHERQRTGAGVAHSAVLGCLMVHVCKAPWQCGVLTWIGCRIDWENR